MNKKFGLVLLFVGVYATLIGGLVWVMHFSQNAETSSLCKPYDWVWGVLIAIVLVIGTVMSGRGYIFGLIGLGIVAIGLGLDIYLLVFGITQQNFLSPLILIGIVATALGFTWCLIAHILEMKRIAKHGRTLLN